MLVLIKRLLFIISLNIGLFLLLLIGIQNSSHRGKVNLIVAETVSLPISFIIGISFITGSISGSILTLNYRTKKK